MLVRRLRVLVPVFAVLLAAACTRGTVPDATTIPPAGVVRSWVTTPDRAQLLARQPDVPWRLPDAAADTQGIVAITVDTTPPQMP